MRMFIALWLAGLATPQAQAAADPQTAAKALTWQDRLYSISLDDVEGIYTRAMQQHRPDIDRDLELCQRLGQTEKVIDRIRDAVADFSSTSGVSPDDYRALWKAEDAVTTSNVYLREYCESDDDHNLYRNMSQLIANLAQARKDTQVQDAVVAKYLKK